MLEFSSFAPLNLIVEAFNTDPSRRGLLSFFQGSVHGASLKDLQRFDKSAFRIDPSDTPAVRCAVAQLRLSSGNWKAEDIDSIVSDLNRAPKEWYFAHRAIRNIEKHPAYAAFLRAACSNGTGKSFVYSPLQFLSNDLDAQPSQLALANKRKELELPDLPEPDSD
jgi:hypothetical protein